MDGKRLYRSKKDRMICGVCVAELQIILILIRHW